MKLLPYYLECSELVIDSRKVTKNCLFLAIKGERFDANDFALEALEKGARYVIADRKNLEGKDSRILYVEDSLVALQELALEYRHTWTFPVIGLTGSNGKTTTKELIHSVLSKKHKVHASSGNFNNHIGVPLTILSCPIDSGIAVIEMGANHQKEIEFLSSLSRPNFGLITNYGQAHLEGFGGVEGVIKGKSELYSFLISNNETAVFHSDDPIQREKLEGYDKKIAFSTRSAEDGILGEDADGYLQVNWNDHSISTQLVGEYNLVNAAYAIVLGLEFEVPEEDICQALEEYTSSNQRSQLLETEKNTVIVDCYNANPSSVEKALESLSKRKHPKKLAVLGDMYELGEDSVKEHARIIVLCQELGLDNSLFVGSEFYNCGAESPNCFESKDELVKYLQSNPLFGALILLKGSRGMAMESLLDQL